ncbi:MAG TPA: aminoglycoside phosphotransferase family protein [Nitrospirota bacterium]|nr:aminoglycoside phosphotransferase family protein [Nitrospirota bacterium]
MLSSVISQFVISGTLLKAERFGSGLINDTYLCVFTDKGEARKYILQRINATVFKKPEHVMQNVETVTTHIMRKVAAAGVADPFSVTPALIRSLEGGSYFRDDSGCYWRMFHFIEAGAVFDTVVDAKHAYEVGRGLGRFQALVSDLDPRTLHDTLPGFHHTPDYLAAYDAALKTDPARRASEAAAETEFVSSRRGMARRLLEPLEKGEIPVRVVHNDPKVNNVMIHTETGEALCMLDLDTVKPGIVHFDFGDCVRSSANPVGEDAEDPAAAVIDLSLFEAVADGYLREAGTFLTKAEIALLPVSIQVITFELGLRFLTDYLRGDTYFKVNHPSHNLHRARVQFRLLESIEAAEEGMREFIARVTYPRG